MVTWFSSAHKNYVPDELVGERVLLNLALPQVYPKNRDPLYSFKPGDSLVGLVVCTQPPIANKNAELRSTQPGRLTLIKCYTHYEMIWEFLTSYCCPQLRCQASPQLRLCLRLPPCRKQH